MREIGSFNIIPHQQHDGFVVDTVFGILPAEGEAGYRLGGYDVKTLALALADIERLGSAAGYEKAMASVRAAIDGLEALGESYQPVRMRKTYTHIADFMPAG